MTIETTEQADLLATAAALAPQIAAARDAIEQQRRVPPALVDALREAGLFRLCIPARLGGPGTCFETFLRVVEAVATVDGSVGWVVMIGGSTGVLAGYLPDAGAAEVFGDPRAITAAALMPKGHAVPVDGGYHVTGRWPFASGLHHCRWVAGECVIDRADEDPGASDGSPQHRTVVLSIDEVEVLDTWFSGGLRGSDSTDFAVHDVFVPTHRTCASGRPDAADAVSRVSFGTWGVPSVAVVGLGIARAALDALIDLAASKVPARRSGVLREHVLVQVHVAEAEAMLGAARSFFYDAVHTLWETLTTTGTVVPAQDLQLKLASSYAIDCALQVVDRMHRAGGSTAVYSGSLLDRCLRDIHVVSQHAGLGVQHYEAAGRAFLGLPAGPSLA